MFICEFCEIFINTFLSLTLLADCFYISEDLNYTLKIYIYLHLKFPVKHATLLTVRACLHETGSELKPIWDLKPL